MSPSVFHFYNEYHIGDNIFNLKYFLYVSNILKARGDTIFYYYNTGWPYNKEEILRSYIDPSVVILKSLQLKPSDAIQLWQGKSLDGVTYFDSEAYFEKFYRKILNFLHIDDPSISTNMWLPEPFLIPVYERLDRKFKDIDILILNNVGKSGQYNNNAELNHLAVYLSAHFNIVTSEKVNESIKSADALTLQEIGAMSTHATYIISTLSGPQIPCFNAQTRDYVKKWFFITSGMQFKYLSIDYLHTINNTSPIKEYFDTLIAGRTKPTS
jgi:hypothetical protein